MEKEKTYGVWAVRSAASIFGRAESWCKEDDKPLEFASQEAAEAYAKECNSRTTANVHYFVKEKEPGAVRRDGTQPDRAARAHEEQTPRNAAVEKLNEIPGRQLSKEPDPLVEIRSAVHSNYAGMVAMLAADNRVYLGREERYHYQDGLTSYYDNGDGSLCFVTDRADMYYFLYGEGWAHSQAEMLERGLTSDQYAEFARLKNGVLRQFEAQLCFVGDIFLKYAIYRRRCKEHHIRTQIVSPRFTKFTMAARLSRLQCNSISNFQMLYILPDFNNRSTWLMSQYKGRLYHIIPDCPCFVIMQVASADTHVFQFYQYLVIFYFWNLPFFKTHFSDSQHDCNFHFSFHCRILLFCLLLFILY